MRWTNEKVPYNVQHITAVKLLNIAQADRIEKKDIQTMNVVNVNKVK